MTQKPDDLVNALRTLATFPITSNSNMDAINMQAIARDALKVLRTQPPQDDWKDISTAPRDGSLILGWCPQENQYNKTKVISYGEPADWYKKSNKSWEGYWGYMTYDSIQHCKPTHWQPLPLPPKPAKTDGEGL